MDYFGTLVVRVTSAGGAWPVEGVTVRVEGRSRETASVFRAQLTDRDGLTEPLPVPAPSPTLSLSAKAKERPYSVLDVFVKGEGFYDKLVCSVSVFANERTVLPVNLIPVAEHMPYASAPRGTQEVQSGENPALF